MKEENRHVGVLYLDGPGAKEQYLAQLRDMLKRPPPKGVWRELHTAQGRALLVDKYGHRTIHRDVVREYLGEEP